MKILCVYHSRDLDGWMSGAIVRHWSNINYGASIYDYGVKYVAEDNDSKLDMLPWDYGFDVPNLEEMEQYDKIIICDVSWDNHTMAILQHRLKENLIWIDHHKSAIEKIAVIEKDIDIAGIRDTSLAACELTWKFFFPDIKVPKLVELLGTYDTFRHINTDDENRVRTFQFGARTLMPSVNLCYKHLLSCVKKPIPDSQEVNMIADVMIVGQYIYTYLKQEAELIRKREFEMEIKGYKFLVVNQAGFNPKNFGIDFHGEGYDGYAIFRFDPDVGFRWTFYSQTIDVSKIATSFKGGGHKGAAGCQLDMKKMNEVLRTNILQ